MDEEFFLEDVEDDMDEEEDLALGAAEDDLTFGDADEDLSLGASKKCLDHIMLSNKDNKPTQRMTKMAMKVFFQFLCSHGIEINIVSDADIAPCLHSDWSVDVMLGGHTVRCIDNQLIPVVNNYNTHV